MMFLRMVKSTKHGNASYEAFLGQNKCNYWRHQGIWHSKQWCCQVLETTEVAIQERERYLIKCVPVASKKHYDKKWVQSLSSRDYALQFIHTKGGNTNFIRRPMLDIYLYLLDTSCIHLFHNYKSAVQCNPMEWGGMEKNILLIM